jgi:hypothetical protein
MVAMRAGANLSVMGIGVASSSRTPAEACHPVRLTPNPEAAVFMVPAISRPSYPPTIL